jgi:hypothetical protein
VQASGYHPAAVGLYLSIKEVNEGFMISCLPLTSSFIQMLHNGGDLLCIRDNAPPETSLLTSLFRVGSLKGLSHEFGIG